ncbi:MAG: DUF1569 domain-containing protein [Vicinamibacterales bacterium]
MGATIWDTSVRASIAARAQRVTADAKPGWGKMNASAMMAHINDSLRMALGDLPVKSKNLPLRYKPIRKLFIYYLPMPKGAPTAPELIARCQNAVLEDEKQAFADLIKRCATIKPGTMLGEHPAFGDLSYDEYGALIAKHTDHHLRQFGV